MRTQALTKMLSMVFMAAFCLFAFQGQAIAADKIGWVGPVYKELAESLTKGFKQYYEKTHGKEVEVTFIHPGGWPVCLDKVRTWGDKPDADIFLGAGAPAHEVLKKEGRIVPYKPKGWDMVPLDSHGMKVKDAKGYWTCFAPWIVTNLYNEKVLKKLRLPPPKTWQDLLNPIYRGNIITTLPYASGTMHETVEIILQAFGEEEGWAYLRTLAAQFARFSTGSTDTTHIVSRGEVPIGLAQPQMNAMVARRDGYPVRDLLPDKTILVPEAVALLKGAPNEAVGKIFLDWLFSMEGQKYVLEGGYFAARTDIQFSVWEKEGVAMATHAKKALGVDSFWDLKVKFIEYDLDLAAKRWDDVNKHYEYEIYRKWGKLKDSLFLIEEVEEEIQAAKAANVETAKAEEKIKEARTLFQKEGNYAAARLAAAKARALLVGP
ncbi:MAG: extracellular solute-binding protein [Deltaproteobacteria bacterium]|nr:extracellular solute-binding protein [Deltaproteobacteria bacterium]MBW1954629.1 extracellular solute-binding protein [Deltaproteobacteria bacterium]MBW2040481.1 extracellular solute-binding protein [Deltaproteobacteria bacterium]MBW2131349.1 extracellular solute-binding protein [Deltaproteobacteria bacterium]